MKVAMVSDILASPPEKSMKSDFASLLQDERANSTTDPAEFRDDIQYLLAGRQNMRPPSTQL